MLRSLRFICSWSVITDGIILGPKKFRVFDDPRDPSLSWYYQIIVVSSYEVNKRNTSLTGNPVFPV